MGTLLIYKFSFDMMVDATAQNRYKIARTPYFSRPVRPDNGSGRKKREDAPWVERSTRSATPGSRGMNNRRIEIN